VLAYDQVLSGAATVGVRVVIIGAGAIAYDMVEFLLGEAPHSPPALAQFAAEYGLDVSAQSAGGRSSAPQPIAGTPTGDRAAAQRQASGVLHWP